MDEDATESLNKDVIRRLLAEMDRGNVGAVEQFYSPTYVDHHPSFLRGTGGSGREALKAVFAVLLAAFPDTVHTIEHLIAEGDLVVARTSARGTHTGSLFGVAPTGRVVTQTNIAIYRLVGGQIVERWSYHPISILEQVGAREDAVTP